MPQTLDLLRRLTGPSTVAREEVSALLADLTQARRDLALVWGRLDSALEQVRRLR